MRTSVPSGVEQIFRPVLSRLEADGLDLFGVPIDLVPVAFLDRPFSYLLRVEVRQKFSALVHSNLFVKVLKPVPDKNITESRDRVAREFDTTRLAWQSMRTNHGLGVVRPMACFPDQLALVTEEVRGETLLKHLERRARLFPSADRLSKLMSVMAAVGRWVAVFQRAESSSGTVSLDALRSYIDLRLQRMLTRPSAHMSARRRAHVLNHFDRLSRCVLTSDLAEVRIHGDLAPGNILVSEERVVVLDFAMAQRGTRFHDVARLHSQLALLGAKPQFRAAVITRMQQALLRGFDPELTESNPLFRLMLLLHRMNNLSRLSGRVSRFPTNLYEARIRSLHLAWLTAELQAAPSLEGSS